MSKKPPRKTKFEKVKEKRHKKGARRDPTPRFLKKK